MIRFGVATFGLSAHDLVEIAIAAEASGFESLWVGEHLLHPVGYASAHPPIGGQDASRRPPIVATTELQHTWVTMGAVAASTRSLLLATGVHVMPLGHPLNTALAAATMHALTGGRFILGLGVGWLREEFLALDAPFSDRGLRFDEGLDVLRKALVGGPFHHNGRYFRIGEVQVTAHALDVPVVLGGNSEPALRRAARVADGYIGSGRSMSFDDSRRLRDRLHWHCAVIGRTTPPRSWFRVGERELDELDRYRDEEMFDLVIRADEVSHGPAVAARQGIRDLGRDLGLAST